MEKKKKRIAKKCLQTHTEVYFFGRPRKCQQLRKTCDIKGEYKMPSSKWRKRIKKLQWLISMPSGNVKQLTYLSKERWRVKIYLTHVSSA